MGHEHDFRPEFTFPGMSPMLEAGPTQVVKNRLIDTQPATFYTQEIDYDNLFSDIDQVIGLASEAAVETPTEELAYIPALQEIRRLAEIGLLEEDDIHHAEMSYRSLLFLQPLLDSQEVMNNPTTRRNLLRVLAAISFQPETGKDLDALVAKLNPDEFSALQDLDKLHELFPRALTTILMRKIVGYNKHELPDPRPEAHYISPDLLFSAFEARLLQSDWNGYIKKGGYLEKSARLNKRRLKRSISPDQVPGIMGALQLVASAREFTYPPDMVAEYVPLIPTSLAELHDWIPNDVAAQIQAWQEGFPNARTVRDLERIAYAEQKQLNERKRRRPAFIDPAEPSFTPAFADSERAAVFRLANTVTARNQREGILPWEEIAAILNLEPNDIRNWLDDRLSSPSVV